MHVDREIVEGKCSKVTTDFTTTSTSIVEGHGSGHPVPTHISILTNLSDYHQLGPFVEIKDVLR